MSIHFKTKYDLQFTNDLEQADLIISTMPLTIEEQADKATIIIDPLLNQNDLLRIEQMIQAFIDFEKRHLF